MNQEIKQVTLRRHEQIANVLKRYNNLGYEFVNSSVSNNVTTLVLKRNKDLLYYDAFKDIEIEMDLLNILNEQVRTNIRNEKDKKENNAKWINYSLLFGAFIFVVPIIIYLPETFSKNPFMGILLVLAIIVIIAAAIFLRKFLLGNKNNDLEKETFISERLLKLNEIAVKIPKMEKESK